MNRRTFFEYLRTFAITIIAVFVIVASILCLVLHQVYEGQDQIKQQSQDDAIDYYLIGVLIDKNKYLEEQQPGNYKINMRLAFLNEAKRDYKNAEIEYKEAINKAPYMEFSPIYKLAILYTRMNRLDSAQQLMDDLDEKPDEKLIEYKADIYNKLGNIYYNQADYNKAALKYQKSLAYYQITKYKHIQSIKNSLASSYVYFAEENVRNMQIEEAINSLKMALTIVNAPIIKYKLALLLMKDNPDLAYEYFEEVFKETPEIINYEEYKKFLSNLAANEAAQGNIAQSELHQYKIKKIDKYFNTNILSIEDLKIDEIQGKFVSNNWTCKDDVYLNIRLKNLSQYNIDSLYLKVIFKDRDLILGESFEQVVDTQSVLKPEAYSSTIAIKILKIPINKDDKPKKITAEIYASKTDSSYKLLLGVFDIKEKIKENKTYKIFKKFYKKIVSKLPAFLF